MSVQQETFVVDLPRRRRRAAKHKKAATMAKKRSAKTAKRKPKGGRAYALKVAGERIRSGKQLREVFLSERGTRKPTVFVSSTAKNLAPLVDVAHHEAGNLRLFVWEKLAPERKEFLQTLFRTVVSVGSELQLLSSDELAAVLSSDRRGDLLVGGIVNTSEGVIVLYRGSFDRMSVPFEWFQRSSDVEPDFNDFEVTDHGQTVRLGDFEASADAILYAFDSSYRSRMKQRQLALDDTLGGSIRRLRELKGLRRTDFAPLSGKEIARIERGEVKKPRQKTLETIAKRTGVAPEDIATF